MIIIRWYTNNRIPITLTWLIRRNLHNWSLRHISPLHDLKVWLKTLLIEFLFIAQSTTWRVRLNIGSLVFHIELFRHLLIFTSSKVLSFICVPIIILFNIYWNMNLIRLFDSLSNCSQLYLILTILLLSFFNLRFYRSCCLEWHWRLDIKVIATKCDASRSYSTIIMLKHARGINSPWCIWRNLSPRISARECLCAMLHSRIRLFFTSYAILHFQNYLFWLII